MPQIKAAKKSLRHSNRRRVINDRWRKKLREATQALTSALTSGDKKAAEQAYQKAQSTIDRAARHNIVHRNKAARQKSRLRKTLQS